MGAAGQGATPLNNLGEVFRETFIEDSAVNSWTRAIRLPDGCTHILPSLNLAIVYIESLQLEAASSAISSFESCFAQYPLKNGEEHKALSHIIRGRIALYRGNIDKAIEHFQKSIELQQWFGKIGINIEDLLAGIYQNLHLALMAKAAHLKKQASNGLTEKFSNWTSRLKYHLKGRWYARKARRLLTEKLNDFEDIFVRHTDSLLDYPVLGSLIGDFPTVVAERLIEKIQQKDAREPARLYYQSYLAENYLNNGSKKLAEPILKTIISNQRSDFDAALRLHASSIYLRELSPKDSAYMTLSNQVFETLPSAILNYDLKLVVNYQNIPKSLRKKLKNTALRLNNSTKAQYLLQYTAENEKHQLQLYDQINDISLHTASVRKQDGEFYQLVNDFQKKIFIIK